MLALMDNVTSEPSPRPLSRRYLLAGLGAGAAVLLGCSGDSTEADPAAAPGSTGTSGPGTSSTTGSAGPSSSTAPTSSTTSAAASSTTAAAPSTLAPTPACDDGDDPTPAQTEGPFFTPNSPLKASFLADVPSGTRLALSGTVVTTDC